MDPGVTGKHTEARLKRWIDSVGTVTLPLLAGFSITAVVVVSDDAANFLLPGVTILVLASARVGAHSGCPVRLPRPRLPFGAGP
jgi:hypothetical protein